ncbi:MAG: hypothetical protein JSU98_09890, partial [Gemmatimonadales bacterium]
GTSGLLRGGRVERGADGSVVVSVQPAVLERLSARHRQALQASLAGVLDDGAVALRLLSEGESPDSERISQDRVREGRLRELIREEPALEHAVKELDLELMD